MNILASYSWLKEYLQTDLSPQDFAKEVSLRSMSVEHIDNVAERFAHMVVGVIKELKAHPNANKLRIAVTDIGEKTVEIVCGGTNLYEGQRVFVALPRSKVKWHGEGDLVELAETEIRGVKSVGMICASVEVGFEKLACAEREIWDLTTLTNAAAGTPIAQALELDDVIFDIEVTTNRPDCMGIAGLARECAAAVSGTYQAHLLQQDPQSVLPALRSSSAGESVGGSVPSVANPSLSVTIQDPKLCPRYMAAVVEGVKVGPSPWWLQKKLLMAGHRPINNIVDITNLVLHEFGQPLHAFDGEKLSGKQIIVRKAQKGESLVALDGKTYQLQTKHLVIADADKPIAVAGVMGGQESGTTDATSIVVFEAATFEPVSVRKTARELNLYSDSQLLFEKGLSTEALPAALAYAVKLATEIAGGRLASAPIDVRAAAYKTQSYPVLFKKICDRIGVSISDDEMKKILERLGFILSVNGSRVTATVPYWRDHDIEHEVDLTEEVARMYGYHHMPCELPTAPPPAYVDDVSLVWEGRIKRMLAEEGFTEFFGYSFIEAKDLERYGLSPVEAIKVWNPLSEDLGYLRTSLMPSVLRDIVKNEMVEAAADVFELSRIYLYRENDIPDERMQLVFATYGAKDPEQAFRRIRGALSVVAQRTGLRISLERIADQLPWHPGRSAKIIAQLGNEKTEIGFIGQVALANQDAFGIVRPVFACVLDIERCIPFMKQRRSYAPVSAFPTVQRDLSFALPERIEYADIITLLQKQPLVRDVDLIEIYRGKGVTDGQKSLTFSFTFGTSDRTLTSEEVETTIRGILEAMKVKFDAEVRG